MTFEDDSVYGFKGLHNIREKIEPQGPAWPKIIDQIVRNEFVWKNRDYESILASISELK